MYTECRVSAVAVYLNEELAVLGGQLGCLIDARLKLRSQSAPARNVIAEHQQEPQVQSRAHPAAMRDDWSYLQGRDLRNAEAMHGGLSAGFSCRVVQWQLQHCHAAWGLVWGKPFQAAQNPEDLIVAVLMLQVALL